MGSLFDISDRDPTIIIAYNIFAQDLILQRKVDRMESEIQGVVDYAVEQPGVSGYICIDKDGLCIAAKGQASKAMSGIIHQLADLACKIEESSPRDKSSRKKEPPVIRVDLERQKILIQSRDSITTALISPQK